MFIASIDRIRNYLLTTDEQVKSTFSEILLKLSDFYHQFVKYNCGSGYKAKMNYIYREILNLLGEMNFICGDDQCVIEVFKVLILEFLKVSSEKQKLSFIVQFTVNSFLEVKESPFIYFDRKTKIIINNHTVTLSSIECYDTTITIINQPEYIVFFNPDYSMLPMNLKIPNYRLHSLISFETCPNSATHFTVCAICNRGYFIYDDLQNLPYGGFQGYLMANEDLNNFPITLGSFFEQVPLFVYKKY